MECHEVSCSVMRAGLRPGRSQGAAPSFRSLVPDGPPRACARIMRARPRPRAKSGGTVLSAVDVMECHVLSCSLLAAAFFSAGFRCLPVPPAGPGAGTLYRAQSPARGRPGAGGRFAAARFARLIARACEAGAGRTSPVGSFGVFSRRRETEEAAPRMPLPPTLIVAHFARMQGSFRELFLYSRTNRAFLPG